MPPNGKPNRLPKCAPKGAAGAMLGPIPVISDLCPVINRKTPLPDLVDFVEPAMLFRETTKAVVFPCRYL